MRSNVLHLDGDDVATTQLAINRQVKHRRLAHLVFELEPGYMELIKVLLIYFCYASASVRVLRRERCDPMDDRIV